MRFPIKWEAATWSIEITISLYLPTKRISHTTGTDAMLASSKSSYYSGISARAWGLHYSPPPRAILLRLPPPPTTPPPSSLPSAHKTPRQTCRIGFSQKPSCKTSAQDIRTGLILISTVTLSFFFRTSRWHRSIYELWNACALKHHSSTLHLQLACVAMCGESERTRMPSW